jgi:hypothetical protein
LPPVEFCFGVSPSQAAKSRPFENIEGDGAMATIAAAEIGPMPGIVVSCRAVSSVFAISLIPLVQCGNTLIQCRKMIEKFSAEINDNRRKCRIRIFQGPGQMTDMLDTLRCDNPVLCKVTAQRIGRLGSLNQQEITGFKNHRLALLLRALDCDKAHRRTRRRLGDRLRISRIILLPFD